MGDKETITPEYVEINTEYNIKINDNKLKIEIKNDEIIFTLIGISFYKYIKKYKYDEITKELDLLEYNNDIEKIYEYLIKSDYKIINEEKTKKLKINNKEIKLNQQIFKNQEIIEILIDEIKEIKEKNNIQNEKIKELIKMMKKIIK